jgi:DNA-binding CsgD family transcriptional regulator
LSDDAASLLGLAGLAYASVDDPSRWDDFLDALRDDPAFVAAAVGFQADLNDPMITGVVRGVSEAHTERLYAEVLPRNPLLSTGAPIPHGAHVMMDDDIVPRSVFEKSSYYRWLRDIGADRVLVAIVRSAPDAVVHMPLYVRERARVTRAHMDRSLALLEHVDRALALSRRVDALEQTCRRSLDAMDRAHFGCVLIGQDRRIEWMNGYAEAIVARGDALLVRDHTLHAAHPDARATLASDVDVALGLTDSTPDAPRTTRRVPKAGGDGHLELLVSPLSPFGHPVHTHGRGALVMLADPDYLDADIASRLETLYGLTPAEAEATQWLLSGYTIDAIAEVFGRSQHTVRNHIKRVLKKCGVSSQAQLVGLIHRGVAVLG